MNTDLKKLLVLRPQEVKYKEFYHKYVQQMPVQPINIDEYANFLHNSDPAYACLLQDDFLPVLNEGTFFHEDLDIAIFQHFRYMPPTWHEHDFFEMSYVLSGSFLNYYQGNTFQTNAGDIMMISPHTQHAVFTKDENGVMLNILIRTSTFEQYFINLLPEDDLLHTFFTRALYQKPEHPYLLFQTQQNPSLEFVMNHIYDEYTHNHSYKQNMLNSMIADFFIFLLRDHAKDVSVPGNAQSLVNEDTIFIMQYMQQHYDTITLKELSDFFNYSERQVERIIQSATGVNFRQNIKRIRMHHAAHFLQKTDLSVQEIADRTGYYDTSHFRHIFKNYYGVTPNEYRTTAQTKPE